jgi:hypothetical protein
MSGVAFRAWKVDETDDGRFVGSEQTCSTDSLRIKGSSGGGGNKNIEEEEFVLIEVSHSSLNYKDALSASGNKGVTRSYPHTPGIDAAGTRVGNKSGGSVLVTGYVRHTSCTIEKEHIIINLSSNGTHSLACTCILFMKFHDASTCVRFQFAFAFHLHSYSRTWE